MLFLGLRYFLLVLSLSIYTLLAPFGYAAFALFSIVPVGNAVQRAKVLQAIVHSAFRFLHVWLRCIRLLDYTPRAWAGVAPRPYIIIANHPSMTDTLAIIATVPHVCAVVRNDIYQKPLFRPMMRTAGYIDAGGKEVEAVARWIELAKERFNAGFSVLIFPEGTRSPACGGLHRMSRVAFELSCQSGVPILALSIREEPGWLGRAQSVFQLPRNVPAKQIEVLDVFNPQDFQNDSRRMRAEVQVRYRSLFPGPTRAPFLVLERSTGVDLPRPTG